MTNMVNKRVEKVDRTKGKEFKARTIIFKNNKNIILEVKHIMSERAH